MAHLGKYISDTLDKKLKNSVIRRSILLLAAVSPGFLFSFLMSVLATFILAPKNYGIFYLAIILIDVLSAPAAIVNLFLSRHFVLCHLRSGLSGAVYALRKVLPAIIYGAAALGIFVMIVLSSFGSWVGIEGHLLIVMIVLAAISQLFFELGRGFLQGVQNFSGLAVYSVGVNFFRFAFCLGLLAIFGRVWTGIMGVGIAGIAGFIGYYHILISRQRSTESRFDLPAAPKWAGLLVVSISYGIMIAVAYADLVVAYFLYPEEILGIYAASSVIPKTFLTLTLPIMQLFFPLSVLDDLNRRPRSFSLLLAKGILAVIIITGSAALFVLMGETYICGGQTGIRYCQSEILQPLLLSSISLSLVRTLVMFDIAKNHELKAIALIPALVIFFIWVNYSRSEPINLAIQFSIFSWFLLAFYFCIGLLFNRVPSKRFRSNH